MTGSVFHQALVHNIIIAVLSVVIQLPISIGLALLLNRRMRGQTALRLAVFTPYVLSQATSAVMWSMLLSHGGPVDSLLKSADLAALIHFWLASTSLVLYTLFFVVTWQFIGFGMVLLLAGLQGIPPELREAAAIDGASSWQITRRIMLPLLGPTIRIWIFLAVIGSLQLFDICSGWRCPRRRSRCRSRSSSCARSCGRSPRNWRTRRPWTAPPGSGSSCGSCFRCPGPALITVGMLAFVTSWNTYLLPLIVLSTPSHFTLPLSVAMFQSQYSTDTARGLRLYRAVHASRPVHFRLRAALPRRRPGRRDQGLSTTQRDEPGHGYPGAADRNGYAPRIPGLGPVCRCYRPAPLGTRCGAPKAASRRSCWSSV